MTPYEKRIREKLKEDFPHYAEKCLQIRTKSGHIAPFFLNHAQEIIHHRLEQQKKEKGYVRALIVKGRQQGCSTYIQARFYWRLSHYPALRAYVMTHLDDATQNLAEIVKRFHAYTPKLVQPSVRRSNVKELYFDKLESSYHFATAKSSGVGRSDTIQMFHGSEVSYWDYADAHLAGVLQAIPDMAETEIILESTSAGAQGCFYDLCMQAQKGQSDYQLIFIPWFLQPEYRLPVPEGLRLTEEEQAYQALYDLDMRQIFWRRQKIMALGRLEKFRREYPASIEEAFFNDLDHALWSRDIIHDNRVTKDILPGFKRIIVAIDPAVTSHAKSDETGIIVAALGEDNHIYILEDLSAVMTPSQWAKKAMMAYHKYNADRIVAETNQGGDMVEAVLRTEDQEVSFKKIYASRGKYIRAEPVAALDEQGKIHHVGYFPKLEDQMCIFTQDHNMKISPDRVDARVWAVTELMSNRQQSGPQIWM